MVELFAVTLAALALGTVVLVLAPLRRRPALDFRIDGTAAADLLAEREAAIQTIRELDLDHQLGNLAEEDHRRLRERHQARAIALLKATSSLSREPEDPLDAEIERAVRETRGRRQRAVAATGTPSATGSSRPSCRSCGQAIDVGDRFCSGCGASLPLTCPACGGPVRPAARFCPQCGQSPSPGAPPPSPGAPPRRVTVQPRERGKTAKAAPAPRPRVPAASSRRPIRWIAGAVIVAFAVLGGIAWVYASSRSAQQDQRPIAQLPAQIEDFHGLAFLPGRSGAALLGYHGGLLTSDDGGRSWRPSELAGDAMVLATSPARPEIVYAAGHDLLVKSEDGGRSWAPLRHDLPGTDVHALAIDPGNPAILYAVVVGRGLFRSDDGGARWTRLTDQMPRNPTGLAVTSGDHQAFFLATADEGVIVSTDGRSWGTASGFLNAALPTRRIADLVYDPRSGDRTVMPTGQAMTGALYAGTDRGLFKSIDGGGSWNRLPLQTDVAAVAVDPNNSQVLLAVDSRGRVFRSEDRGLTWQGRR